MVSAGFGSGAGYLSLILVVLAVFVGLLRVDRLEGNQIEPVRSLVAEYQVESNTNMSWQSALAEILQSHDIVAEIVWGEASPPLAQTAELAKFLELQGVGHRYHQILAYGGVPSSIKVRLWVENELD
jgi:hypothetical protein